MCGEQQLQPNKIEQMSHDKLNGLSILKDSKHTTFPNDSRQYFNAIDIQNN